MSVHKSLRVKSRLVRSRNVMTRLERIEKLEDAKKWEEGKSVFGLPKVRTIRPKVRRKAAAKKEEAAAPGAEGAAAPAAAAPAAGKAAAPAASKAAAPAAKAAAPAAKAAKK